MFAAGKTAAVSGAAPDDKFNYVTMLLHGDGTNGGQNNTFLDSSTNNFTITRNGNTTQGSFSPYGSNWSNYFNGSTDYLSLGTSTNLALGAGDFTIEVWLSVTAYNASTSNIFEWRSAGGVPSNIPTLYLSASGVPTFYASVGSGALITGSSAVALNTWTHLAIVRNGSTVTMYLNGTSVGSASNSANLGTQSFYINDPQGTFRHNGYFSNVRMVKGTAVYTGAFTPSTTPLTAITNTQLLTCQSNRFVDNSANAFSSTITGTPSVQRFNPFGTSTAYSTSVIGGSGYFDGSGDYLSIANNSAFAITSNAFTAEAWVYPTTISASWQSIAGVWSTANGLQWIIQYRATDVRIFIYNGGFTAFSVTTTITANQWHHIVVQRDGSNTASIYVNGTRINTGSYSNVGSASTSDLNIGRNGDNSEYVTGYISDFKFVKNSAIYSGATITVPTSPATTSNSPAVLTNFTNGAIIDNAMMNNLETVGNAQISTTVKKYGTGSLAFDGTGDYLVPRASPNNSLGSGNFTIECWVNPSIVNNNAICGLGNVDNTDTSSFFLRLENGYVNFYTTGNNRYAVTYTSGSWYHLAVVRSSGTVSVYWDGTQIGSGISITNNFSSTDFYVASGKVTGTIPYNEFNGYIDDFRITKGYARYTANFTAPTSALSDTGPY